MEFGPFSSCSYFTSVCSGAIIDQTLVTFARVRKCVHAPLIVVDSIGGVIYWLASEKVRKLHAASII